MSNNKNNMDNFLRDSLSNITAAPSQSVWKGITKRLIILELLRLNFTNVGKAWLYSGMATVATISGLAYFNLTHQTEEKPIITETPQTEQITNTVKETEPIEIVASAVEAEQTSTAKETTAISETTPLTESTLITETTNSKTEETIPQKQNNKENNSELYTLASSKESIGSNEYLKSSEREDTPILLTAIPIEKLPELSSSKVLNGIGRGQMKPFILQDDEKNTKAKKAEKSLGIDWVIGASYTPEWPLSDEDMYVYNHQYLLNGGIELDKWSFNIGLGLRTEKTPSMFMSEFQSYDSVGYYYDIEYYEPNPDNPDSIILYYNIENIYDSVDHHSESHGPDQRRRWIFIPVSVGYQLYSTPKYQLYANLFGQFGWEYYTETAEMDLKVASGSTMKDITPEVNPNYLQIGIGFENNYQLSSQWRIYAEPRLNYYINTPYSINQTSGNGPYSFGIKVGVKYKLKRRNR
jgi:hypothetical protein